MTCTWSSRRRLFIAAAKAAGLRGGDLDRVIERLARRSDAGDVIQGTGGARKIRVAGRGKGKSGGYRVITFYTGADLPVFLLTVFAKGERVGPDHSRAQCLGAADQDAGRQLRRGRRQAWVMA